MDAKQEKRETRTSCDCLSRVLFIHGSSIALLLLLVEGILQILDIFVQLSSLSNRFGCLREPKDKHPNPKDSRFGVSISERPSDLMRQRNYTPPHPYHIHYQRNTSPLQGNLVLLPKRSYLNPNHNSSLLVTRRDIRVYSF